MKNILLIAALFILISGCKKNNPTLIGNTMDVTRSGSNIQLYEINIFSPNGDGLNDEFFGPLDIPVCQLDSNDKIVSYVLKINGNAIPYNRWDGIFNNAVQPEGIYNYEVDYSTLNGTAKATGLVRLWRSSHVPCDEKPIYKFESGYDSPNCSYDSLGNENLPCN